MRTLFAVSLALFVAGCSETPAPPPASSAHPATTSPSASAAATGSASASAAPSASASAPPARDIAGASHVLIAWKGAELAAKTVTRSKDEAKKRAEEALSKIKKDNLPFAEAVKTYSDDETSKKTDGALGNFERYAMPAAFAKATFDQLKVDEISDLVETARGFHIIKRTR